jgi:hypothetical protein
VLRQVGAAWLGWAATVAAAAWVALGGAMAGGDAAGLWAPALFVPAAAALHLALLPGAALDGAIGRRLAWVPFAVLAAAGLLLVPETPGLVPAAGLLLLTPVAVWKGAAEPRGWTGCPGSPPWRACSCCSSGPSPPRSRRWMGRRRWRSAAS